MMKMEGGLSHFFHSAGLWGSSLAKKIKKINTSGLSRELGDSILYHEKVFNSWFDTVLKMEFSECYT